jgi:hypothetical protein
MMKLIQMKQVKFYNIPTIFYYKDDEDKSGKMWQQAALDRFRFKQRIDKMELLLSRVLTSPPRR